MEKISLIMVTVLMIFLITSCNNGKDENVKTKKDTDPKTTDRQDTEKKDNSKETNTTKHNEEKQNTDTTSNIVYDPSKEANITNISGVKLSNLTKLDNRLNTTLVSFNTGQQAYFINNEYDIYTIDKSTMTLGDKVSSARVIGNILQEDERIISFDYYNERELLEKRALDESTNKENTYIIDTKTNTQIDIKHLFNKTHNKSDVITDLVGTYSNGSKAIILTRSEEETYSALYVLNTLTDNITPIIKNVTILGYSMSNDRTKLVFYGTTKSKLDPDSYDFTSPGNFFLYYRGDESKSQGTGLHILDLETEQITLIPDSEDYYYANIREGYMWIEDAYGEFIKVNHSTGEELGDIESAVFRVMDYYHERHTTKISKNYTLIGTPTEGKQNISSIYYLEREPENNTSESSPVETIILELDKSIFDIIVIDESRALFSYKTTNDSEIVYLLDF